MTEEVWTCDTCGKPLVVGGFDSHARYTIADNPEEKTGRHYDCHVPIDVAVERVKESAARALDALAELRRKTR